MRFSNFKSQVSIYNTMLKIVAFVHVNGLKLHGHVWLGLPLFTTSQAHSNNQVPYNDSALIDNQRSGSCSTKLLAKLPFLFNGTFMV